MADNHITAWLRLRDRLRFSREAARAARDIREINRAADEGNSIFEKFSGFLSGIGEKTRSLTPRTRIFGFAIGTVATALVAAIPLVVGLGGAITALVGSFASAAIGATLLAGALVGVLGAGLGATGLVAFDFLKNFGAVNERFQTWRNAVASFGRNSTQAQTAFQRLAGVIQNNGGPAVFQAVRAWQELRDLFEKSMTPVIEDFTLFMGRSFDKIAGFMPTLVNFTSIATEALIPVFDKWIDLITGPEISQGLGKIASSFQRIVGPIGDGIQNIFLGMFRLLVRVLPWLNPVADGFQSIAKSSADWAATGDLSGFKASLESWFDLFKAFGGLMVTVFTGGAKAGDSLVQSLTGAFNSWNAALKEPGGRQSLIDFFNQSIDMTKALAAVLGGFTTFLFKFGHAALPVYSAFFKAMVSGWRAIEDAVAPAEPFWKNVLQPLLIGIVKGVGGTLVGVFKLAVGILKVFSIALGWLGDAIGPSFRGAFEILGQVIGFLFGGPILKALGSLGKLSILLKPLGFLFKGLYQPIRLMGRAVEFAFGKLFGLGGLFAGFAGRFIPALRNGWNTILGWMSSVLGSRLFGIGLALWRRLKEGFAQGIGAGLGFAGDLAKAFYNAVAGFINMAIPNKIHTPGPIPDIPLPDNPLPLLASGGVVSGFGSWITGEAGPELNTLTTGGQVVVQPLSASVAAPPGGSVSLQGEPRVMVSKVYLRGRQIAEAVADEAADDRARRGRRK